VLNPDNTPADGAHVTLVFLNHKSPYLTFEATADSKGVFSIPLDSERATLASRAGVIGYTDITAVFQSDKGALAKHIDAYYLHIFRYITIKSLPYDSEQAAGQYHLQPITDAKVRIVDEEKKPVSSLDIRVSAMNSLASRGAYNFVHCWAKSWQAKTDVDGYAEFKGLPIGSVVFLTSDDPRFAEINSNRHCIDLRKSDHAETTEIPIARAASISGRAIIAATAKGAPGIAVSAYRLNELEQDSGLPNALASAFGLEQRPYYRVTTDKDGNFTFACLPNGRYDVHIATMNSKDWTAEALSVFVLSGENSKNDNLALAKGGIINGAI